MALDVALDIGTSHTRLATRQRGVLFDEPTMVAIDTNTGDVLEVGDGALNLVGRTSRHVVVFRPFNQGATVDFDVTARLIAALFDRAGVSKLSRARVVMSVPSLATAIERRALRQAAVQAGAREVSLIEAPLAAAIGLGMPVQDPVGSAVTLLGAGASEAAIISLGGIVASESIRIAGDELDDAIITYVKKEYALALGERTAEEIKIALGSAYPLQEELYAEVRGRDLVTGLPKTIVVSTQEIREAIEEPVAAIVDTVKVTLDKTPPELAADIMTRGIVATGGGAMLHGLSERLNAETGMPIVIAANPLYSVVQGSGQCLENFDVLKGVLSSTQQ